MIQADRHCSKPDCRARLRQRQCDDDVIQLCARVLPDALLSTVIFAFHQPLYCPLKYPNFKYLCKMITISLTTNKTAIMIARNIIEYLNCIFQTSEYKRMLRKMNLLFPSAVRNRLFARVIFVIVTIFCKNEKKCKTGFAFTQGRTV